MNRFTNILKDKAYLKCSCPDGEYFQKMIERLAEYEELDEKGLIKRKIEEVIINNIIGKSATITKISDGSGCESNDNKYIGKAYKQVVKIVSQVSDENVDLYITDFFIQKFINESNDYIHYGFLKVSNGNITLLNE